MSAPAAERTRTFSWQDPAAGAVRGARLSGLEFLREIARGAAAPPPVAAMLGLSITLVDEGRVVFAMDPAEWMYNPLGSVHGGIAATILDSCMGCAVHTLLPAGVGYTTSDLHVRYVRAMAIDTGQVLAEGRVLHRGRRTATAEGRLYVAGDESLIAHATTGCVILGG
jgi:uncharacterized protein (TIGR00369 family)